MFKSSSTGSSNIIKLWVTESILVFCNLDVS